MRRFLLAPLALVVATALLAQDTPSVTDKLARAEQALKEKKPEDAALLLREAALQAATIGSPTLRTSTLAAIQKLLDKADPLEVQRKKAFSDAAKPLLELAQLYASAKWFATALTLVDACAPFDPEAARGRADAFVAEGGPALARLRGLGKEPDAPTDNTLLLEHFTAAEQPFDKLAWHLSPNVAESPTLAGDTASLLLGKRVLPAKAAIALQIMIGDKAGSFALLFGAKGKANFCALTLEHGKAYSIASVDRWDGKEWTQLHRHQLRFLPEARASWQSLAVEFEGEKARIKIGADVWVDVPPAGLDFGGRIGLFVPAESANRSPVAFRNLVVTPR